MTDLGRRSAVVATAAFTLLPASDLFPAETAVGADNLQRPVALSFDETDQRLLVANGRSGSIAVIDAETLEVINQQPVCSRIIDFLGIPGRNAWLALDSADDRLMLVDEADAGFRIAADIPIPPAAARLAVSGDGTLACLSCIWSRSVTLVAVEPDEPKLAVLNTIDLPFPPRELLLFDDDQRLLVASAFRGELAVVNLELQWVESVREIRGHNIRELALSADGDEVYVTHQQLHGLARADFDDIHWGNLLTNGLRVMPADALREPDADLNRRSEFKSIGMVSDAAGDPGRILVASPERTIVALAGVGQVAVGHPETGFERLDVGLRPAALALDPGRNRLFVANSLDDSISVIDLNAGDPEQTIALGPAVELTPAERGEQLFFNARLSHDGWMSCHTCHSDGHTVDLSVDTLGDGDYGAPKRIPSLLGVGETAPYAWNGSMPTLEQQIRKSVTTTMHGYELAEDDVAALAAFLRTLQPPPGASLDEAAVERGREFFEQARCARCHTPPAYTSDGTYDVGLSDERNRSEFNPPSLRGVGRRTRFFHDGRGESLEEVFRVHQHQLDEPIGDQQIEDLIQFLESL